MENTNENSVNEVKEAEVNKEAVEQKSNGSDKKLIIKIVVGVLIFLAIVGIAAFIFWLSVANKIVDRSKDSINSIVNLGQSLVDDALEGTGIDKVESNRNNVNSAVTNNIQSNTKTSITADKFAEVMKEKGYVIYDHTSEYTQYGSHFLKMLVAEKDGHQIEFTVVTTSESAITGYNTNKAKFEEQKGNTASYFTVSRDNYNTYTLTTNGMYKYLARVDNTLLYIDVAEEYKETVKNIVNVLGY